VLPLKDNIPTRRFPVLTVGLIVANVLMFFLFQKARITLGGADVSEPNLVQYGAIPFEITHPGEQCVQVSEERALCGSEGTTERRTGLELPPTILTAFTSMFMHGGLIHIAGNMLFLWIFGNNIEDSMGRLKFVAFYLLGGLAALGAQTFIDPDSTAPTIGASGAVAAVLGAYALLYPRARVVTLVFIIFFVTVIELPALLVLGGWFLLQIYDASLEPVGGGGGVAYFAHIGGFLFGLLLIKVFADRARSDYEIERRLPVY
jgi:membrane associated rhomboid family serine protease